MNPREVCEGKKRWGARHLADAAASLINETEQYRRPLCSYHCWCCDGFHLTTAKGTRLKRVLAKRTKETV